MLESTHSTLAVAGLALAVALSGVAGPLPVESATPSAQMEDSVRLERFSVDSVTLRNVTARDIVVRKLTVRRMGTRRNVTLQNVSIDRLSLRRATMTDLRLRDATVRSDGLISDLGVHYARGANVTNESRQTLVVRNRTLDGVFVQRLTVQNASGVNISVTDGTANVTVPREAADLVLRDASVGSVVTLRAGAGNETFAA